LVDSYIELYARSEEVCEIEEKHKRIIAQLQAEKEELLSSKHAEKAEHLYVVSGLQNEVTLLSSNLENMTKSVIMLNNGTNMLDEILMVGKQARDSTGIGFKMNYGSKTPETKCVPAQQKPDFRVMWTYPTPHQKPAHKEKFTAWKCHYIVERMVI
jgi:hypothetical protein